MKKTWRIRVGMRRNGIEMVGTGNQRGNARNLGGNSKNMGNKGDDVRNQGGDLSIAVEITWNSKGNDRFKD